MPRSAEEALHCPHGRPPLPLLAFGFGGRTVSLRLGTGPRMGGSQEEAGPSLGVLQVLPLEAAASQLGSSPYSCGEQKVCNLGYCGLNKP